MSPRPMIGALLMATLLWAGLLAPAEAQFRRNQFAPTGGMCRAACGPDCPDTCRRETSFECAAPSLVRRVERYTCGVHQGCRDHDFCLDNCAAAGEGQTGAEFYLAECNRECHGLTVIYAMGIFGRREGLAITRSWAAGNGPFSGEMTWEYTRDSPDAPENVTRCPPCSRCQQGVCVPLDEEVCELCLSCGDVHMRSLDGLRYDFQSHGDFILVDSPDGTRVEARQLPYGSGVSVNSAMAARLGGQLVRVWLQPSPGVELDGRPLHGPSPEPVALANGGQLLWHADGVLLRSADGWRVSVRMFKRFLNIAVVPPGSMRGQLRGLLGDGDGDPGNDLVGRDGTAYATELELDALYDGFGASWRLHPDKSLLAGLTWPAEVAKDGSGRPEVIASLVSLDPQRRWEAEIACGNVGLEGRPNFDACVLDFAVTGDPEMIDSAILSADGSRDVRTVLAAQPSAPQSRADVVIAAPRQALAGTRIEVSVSGDIEARDRIALLPRSPTEPRPINSVRVGEAQGEPLALLVPPEPGSYQLAYLRYPSDSERAAQPFEVLPLRVALAAPSRVPAGSRVEVLLDGEGHTSDLVVIAPPDAPMTYMGEHARRGRGDRVEVLAPSLPGSYELRYLIDQRRHLVARQALDVAPLRVSLDAPPSAQAGGPLTVDVIGEANPSDFVVVVPEGAPSDDTQLKNLHARLGRDLTRVQFRNLPREPGQYEIRYLIDRGRVVAARRALRIEAPTP